MTMEWKMENFRGFIEYRLLPDLKRVLKHEERLEIKVREYERLIQEIDSISSIDPEEPKVKLELPGNIIVTAIMNDRKSLLVDIGKEIFVELSFLEALRFCHEKIYHLKRLLSSLYDREVEIRAHLDMTVFTLQELQKVPVSL